MHTDSDLDGQWFDDPHDDVYSFSQLDNPYMYTGRRYDPETSLYYYRARTFNPAIGRFLQPDPIGYADGMNIYAYCGNDPVNWIDPFGLAVTNVRQHGMAGPVMRRGRAVVYDVSDDTDFSAEAAALSGDMYGIANIQDLYGDFNFRLTSYDSMYIIDHGWQGGQELGNSEINPNSEAWRKLSSAVRRGGTIYLTGCNIALGEEGKRYLQDLADTSGRNIVASDKTCEGNTKWPGGAWTKGDIWMASPGGMEPNVVSPNTISRSDDFWQEYFREFRGFWRGFGYWGW